MKVSKWTSLILVTICSICPAAAQQTSASNATVTKRLESAVLRAQAKAAAQQPVKHCVWCGRVETEEAALTPCPTDPDVHCYFVAEPSVEPIQIKSSSDKAAKSSPLSNTPISSKHCVRCGRAETEEATLTPCPADPDAHCSFAAEGTDTKKNSSTLTPDESNPETLYHAEELLQLDSDRHAGNPQHSPEYDYRLLK